MWSGQVVAGSNRRVSDAPEIKRVCSVSRGRFAVCLAASDDGSLLKMISVSVICSLGFGAFWGRRRFIDPSVHQTYC